MTERPPTAGKRLLQLAAADKPQERMLRMGARSLTDGELLAMVLRSGTAAQDVLTLAESILLEAASLAALSRWQPEDFLRFKGVGRVKALQLCSLFEVARRLSREELPAPAVVKEPQDLARLLRPEAGHLPVEKFWVVCLNTRQHVLKVAEASSGTATSSLAHPREVFREAIRCSATGIAIAHNHPSGDPAPSSADIQVTRQLREASRIVGIDLVDHVILGRESADPLGRGWYSFRQSGLL